MSMTYHVTAFIGFLVGIMAMASGVTCLSSLIFQWNQWLKGTIFTKTGGVLTLMTQLPAGAARLSGSICHFRAELRVPAVF